MTLLQRRVLAALRAAAEAGEPCPTNAALAGRAEASSTASVSYAVQVLERRGLIRVWRGHDSRVVEIVASGARTAGVFPSGGPASSRVVARGKAPAYSAAQDDELRHLWEVERLPSAEIGRRMGLTKNAVIGRARRLGLTMRRSPIRGESRPGPGPLRRGAAELARVRAMQTRSHRDAVGGAAEAQVRPTGPAEPGTTPRPGPSVPRVAAHGPAPGAAAPTPQRAASPLGARTCQFPLWPDRAGRGHPLFGTFCGRRSVCVSYCAEHAARCFASVRIAPEEEAA